MSQPILSIGMIVKNEERCLEKCLKALAPLRQAIPCELIIADTGSTDKTVEIATKYADNVFYFKWVNDFSAARNAVMDKCSGKWYLTVDADEYLLPDVNEIVNFLKSPLASKKTFATITQRNYNDVEMKGTYSDFNALRMTRMNSGNRYGGTIHEAFHVTDLDTVQILADTVFDHDGYTAVTPKHLRSKEKRNLDLLEANLSKNPNDLKCVLQCLESSAHNPEKKRYYTEFAFEKLTQLPDDEFVFSEFVGPPCIRTIINYAIADNNPHVEEYVKFAFKKYPDYNHILIDVNFLYAGFLYKKGCYEQSVKYLEIYLKEVEKYRKTMRNATITAFTTPVLCVHKNYETEAISTLLNSFIKLREFDKATALLSKIDLATATTGTINNWVLAVANKDNSEALISTAVKEIGGLLHKYHNQELKSNTQYETLITTISKTFTCKEIIEHDYNHFKDIPGAIGLSVKIANAKTKKEAEKFLNEIEDWEEFMPLALKNAIKLNAELPDSFFFINAVRMSYLIQNLIYCINDISDNLIKTYFNNLKTKEWHKISFYFNLLLSVLLSNDLYLDNETKAVFIKKFCEVSDIYLNTCYNKKILENEDYASCIPQIHLFAWYLVKANCLKERNPLEYIKTLRTAINKVPQSKRIVEFLIEEFKQEEEQKKQEQIKNAAPELVAMAEQLKTMLKAFPENSPELLAIKQSPMYKQVAFLIED